MPATSTNMFGSIFGSNNAPPPIPGGWGNPTGSNPGGMTGATNTLPGITPYSNIPTASPIFQGGVQPFNTSGINNGPYGSTNLAGTSSGISGSGLAPGTDYSGLLKELTRAYGKGTGSLLDSILTKGLYNPSVANAILNAQQPGINRGEQDLLSSFGGAGARYSSAASLGLGDYLSQVNLNQQSTLANMYQTAQMEQMSILQGVLPTMHTEQANHGGGWLDTILGGLEVAGGIALSATGAGAGLGAGLITGGLGTVTKGVGSTQNSNNASNSSGGSGLAGLLQTLINNHKASNSQTSIGITGNNGGQTGGGIGSGVRPGGTSDLLGVSAGSDLGGINPYSPSSISSGMTDTSDPQMQELLQMIMQGQAGNA